MSAAARDAGRLPKRIIDSPNFESSTLASAVAQNSKEAFSPATNLSLLSVSASFASGAGAPEIFEHSKLLDCTMCITRCPNEFISGVGLNPYFSAGMASAAATMFLAKRGNCDFTVVLTGFATGTEVSCARAATTANSITKTNSSALPCRRACPCARVPVHSKHDDEIDALQTQVQAPNTRKRSHAHPARANSTAHRGNGARNPARFSVGTASPRRGAQRVDIFSYRSSERD